MRVGCLGSSVPARTGPESHPGVMVLHRLLAIQHRMLLVVHPHSELTVHHRMLAVGSRVLVDQILNYLAAKLAVRPSPLTRWRSDVRRAERQCSAGPFPA